MRTSQSYREYLEPEGALGPEGRPAPRSPARDAARGAIAGLLGTVAINAAMKAGQRVAPEASPPMREDPGKAVVEQARQATGIASLPPAAEKAGILSAQFGYGAAMGATYGLLRLAASTGGQAIGTRGGATDTDRLLATRSEADFGDVVLEGTALGLAVWAVGYLGWLPATGFMPPISEQRPAQVAAPILNHLLYGLVTAGAYHAMRKLMGRA